MDKDLIFTGVILSVLLHAGLWMMSGPEANVTESNIHMYREQCPVDTVLPEIAEDIIKEQKEEPLHEKTKAEPVKQEEKFEKEESNSLKELFDPDSINTDEGENDTGDILSKDKEEDSMPALRLDISDYDSVIGAIKSYGMKIALIDDMGNFIDELSVTRSPIIVPLKEELSKYSNRVRMLPLDYFGGRIKKILMMRNLKPCILVPVKVDLEFADEQKRVIARKGYDLSEVKATGASFKHAGSRHVIDIEMIFLKNGEEVLL